MTFLYREHRGGLADSMDTVVELESKDQLEKLILSKLDKWGKSGQHMIGDMTVEPYGFDDRIGWDTHIVMMGVYAHGFTNKAVEDESQPPKEGV